MKVLITNLRFGGLSGTEQHAGTLAHALSKRGHVVAVYSPATRDGQASQLIDGVRVFRTCEAVDFEPDVLHCHHLPSAIDAVLRWPGTPSLFVVHDAGAWHDALPPLEGFDLLVAVDRRCAERVAEEAPGVPVEIVPNPVELDRLALARRSEKPRSLLVYGKSASRSSWNRSLQVAAFANGIWRFRTLQGDPDPLRQLGRYDIVLARARCAMEAILSGAYTILFDRGICGGAVTSRNVEHLLRWNFGRGILQESLTFRRFNELIRGYSADDALEAARILRPLVDPDSVAAAFESLYQRCISVRPGRARNDAAWRDKLIFARRLSQAMTRTSETFPSSRTFFRGPPRDPRAPLRRPPVS